MARVKDPVCGMTIESTTATGQRSYEGRMYYFCSTGCLEAFEAEPSRYADTGAEAQPAAHAEQPEDQVTLEQHEPPRTTIGWFTAPKFGAAGGGGLEYELLPEAHTEK